MGADANDAQGEGRQGARGVGGGGRRIPHGTGALIRRETEQLEAAPGAKPGREHSSAPRGIAPPYAPPPWFPRTKRRAPSPPT